MPNDLTSISDANAKLSAPKNSLPSINEANAKLVAAPTNQQPQQPILITPSVQKPTGLVEGGNIDLSGQPSVDNPETGGKSTVWSMSIGTPKGETLISRVTPDGRILSEKDAIDYYHQTGKNLGTFKNVDAANQYAEQLHQDYANGKIKVAQPAQPQQPDNDPFNVVKSLVDSSKPAQQPQQTTPTNNPDINNGVFTWHPVAPTKDVEAELTPDAKILQSENNVQHSHIIENMQKGLDVLKQAYKERFEDNPIAKKYYVGDPLGQVALESDINSAQSSVDGMKKIANADNALQAAAGAVQTGMGALGVVPAVTTFNVATNAITPSITQWLSPVQTILNKTGGKLTIDGKTIISVDPNNKNVQSVSELLDAAVQILGFKKLTDIGSKIKNGIPLSPNESAQAFNAIDDFSKEYNPKGVNTETLSKMPVSMPDNLKIKAAPLIEQNDDLRKQNEDLNSQKEKLAPEFHPIIDENIKANEQVITDNTDKVQAIIKEPTEQPKPQDNGVPQVQVANDNGANQGTDKTAVSEESPASPAEPAAEPVEERSLSNEQGDTNSTQAGAVEEKQAGVNEEKQTIEEQKPQIAENSTGTNAGENIQPTPDQSRQFAINMVKNDFVEKGADVRQGDDKSGARIPANINERLDIGLPSAVKNRAIRDIKAGNYETSAAKSLIDKLSEFHQKDEFPYMRGTGGNTDRFMAMNREQMGKYLDNTIAPEIGANKEQLNKFLSDNGYLDENGDIDYKKLSVDLNDNEKLQHWGALLQLSPEHINELKTFVDEQARNESNSASETNEPVSAGENKVSPEQADNDNAKVEGGTTVGDNPPPSGEPDKVEVKDNGKLVGIRHADIDEQRENMDMKPMEKMRSITAKESQDAGREIYSTENMDMNVKRWDAQGTTLNAAEQYALQLHIADLSNKHDSLFDKWQEAKKRGDTAKESEYGSQFDDIRSKLDEAHAVAKNIRSEVARTLGSHWYGVDKELTFAKMSHEYMRDNNTLNVPEEVQQKLRDLSKQYEESDKKLNEALEREKEKDLQLEAQAKVIAERRAIDRENVKARKDKRHQTKDERIASSRDRIELLKKKAQDIAKKSASQLHDLGGALKTSLEFADVVKSIVNEHIKQAIEEGKVKLVDVIDKAHIDLKEAFEDITHRDIMEIYSDYGKVKQPTPDEYLKAKNQIKSESFYKSATSEAEEGKPPYKRVTPAKETPEVRAARQEMEEAMKKDGIAWDSRPLAERRKSALDKVKQTLLNQIDDISKAIEDNKAIDRTKDKVQLDDAAQELTKLRDEAKQVYNDHFGVDTKKIEDEAKIKAAQRDIDKINERIKNNDFADKEKKAKETDNPDVKAAWDALDKAKQNFIDARNESNPDYENNKYQEYLQKFYDKKKAEYQDKIDNQDFAVQPKVKRPINNDTFKAWQEREAVKHDFERERDKWQNNQKNKSQRVLEAVNRWVRSGAISRVGSILKLGAFAMQELALQPVDRFTARNITGKLFPDLAKTSWEAQKIKPSQEVKAISDAWNDVGKQALQIWKSGKTGIDLLVKGQKFSFDNELISVFGKIHQMEKYLVKQSTFNLAFQTKMEMAKAQGVPIDNLANQFAIWQDSLKEANRNILLGDNILADKVWKGVKNIKTGQPGVDAAKDFLLGYLFPVVKVPTNHVIQGLDRTYGLPAGLARYGIDLAAKGFDGMKDEEKQRVFRMLNKGLYGAAITAIGWYGYKSIGGYYVPGVKQDQKQGTIDGLPALLFSNPRFAPLFIGSTAHQVFDHETKKEDPSTKIALEGIYAATLGIIQTNPFSTGESELSKLGDLKGDPSGAAAKTFVNPLNPGIVQEFAQALDNYRNGKGFKSGNLMNRKPKGFLENIEAQIPGLREYIETADERKHDKKEGARQPRTN